MELFDAFDLLGDTCTKLDFIFTFKDKTIGFYIEKNKINELSDLKNNLTYEPFQKQVKRVIQEGYNSGLDGTYVAYIKSLLNISVGDDVGSTSADFLNFIFRKMKAEYEAYTFPESTLEERTLACYKTIIENIPESELPQTNKASFDRVIANNLAETHNDKVKQILTEIQEKRKEHGHEFVDKKIEEYLIDGDLNKFKASIY